MRSLDAAQAQKHFIAVFELAFHDTLSEPRQRLFDLGYKATADGLLFFLPPLRAAQDVGLLAPRNVDLLDLYFRSDLFEIILEQFLFELLELAARSAHQILAPALADGHQVLFTYHTTIKDPDPPCFPMFPFYRAKNRFHGGNIGAVPIKQFVAERKTVRVDDQRQYQLFEIGAMIPRVTPPHHGVLFRRSFHIRAGQVVEQHIELRLE